jgi:hypothetical protein
MLFIRFRFFIFRTFLEETKNNNKILKMYIYLLNFRDRILSIYLLKHKIQSKI